MLKLSTPARVTCVLASLVFGAIIIIYTKDFLLPMVIAAFLSLLLYPVHKKLNAWKVPRVLSVIIVMLLVIVLFAAMAIIISSQIKMLITDIGGQGNKINEKFMELQAYVSSHSNISSSTIASYVAKIKISLIGWGGNIASGAVTVTTGFIGKLVLVVIFIFCFLLYNDSFSDFAFAIRGTKKRSETFFLISHIQKLVQNYLVGMLIVISIIGILNSIGLLIIGVDHAIFFAFFAGILTIIPYIGISIGASLAVIYLLLTRDSFLPAAGALGIMVMVQILESNFITPKVVGSKVSLNPFVAITALAIGGTLWGIAGMALSIPITAVLKLLLDTHPRTKAFGYFLGNEFIDVKVSPFKLFGMKEIKPLKGSVADTKKAK